MTRKITHIIVHHSACDDTAPQFARINEWHKERGFPYSELGWYVGYHYVIEHDGLVRRARSDNEMGAHDAGENDHSIGICLAGNFDRTTPSAAQVRSLGQLLVQLVQRYDIRYTDIEPHRRGDDTHCYGLMLPDDWASMVYVAAEPRLSVRAKVWIAKNILGL